MTFRAEEPLDPAAFHILAQTRGIAPREARKRAKIAARRATAEERVVSQWNGAETTNLAQPGDYVATALDTEGRPLIDAAGAQNRYVIRAETFAATYAPAEVPAPPAEALGAIYAKITTVLALYLQDGFDILAPWGERQRADRGYLLLSGAEVYGNHADTFETTYEFVHGA